MRNEKINILAAAAGLVLFAALSGCSKTEDGVLPGRQEASHTVTFIAAAEPEENIAPLAAKSVLPDEAKIADVNLWAFHTATGNALHFYSAAGTEPFGGELPPGGYDLYAVANVGRDLGGMARPQVEALAWETASEDDMTRTGMLPMAVPLGISVPAAAPVRLPLKRLCARLDVTCTVEGDAAEHFVPECVQLCGVPRSNLYFSENGAPAAGGAVDYEPRAWEGGALSFICYLPENCTGENTTITDPKQRSWDKAPTGSTCILIKGMYDGNPTEYRIYPGSSLTEFNVRRNNRYVLNVAVRGNDFSDRRQSSCMIEIEPFPESCRLNDYASGYLDIYSINEPAPYYSFMYQVTQGVGTVLITALSEMQPGVFYPIITEPDTGVGYTILFYATSPGPAEVTLTFRDRYGREFVRTYTTQVM